LLSDIIKRLRTPCRPQDSSNTNDTERLSTLPDNHHGSRFHAITGFSPINHYNPSPNLVVSSFHKVGSTISLCQELSLGPERGVRVFQNQFPSEEAWTRLRVLHEADGSPVVSLVLETVVVFGWVGVIDEVLSGLLDLGARQEGIPAIQESSEPKRAGPSWISPGVGPGGRVAQDVKYQSKETDSASSGCV